MDNFDNLTPAQPDSTELQAQVDSLRRLVLWSLLLLLLLSGTFNLLLWRHVRWAGSDLAQADQQALQIQSEYNMVSGQGVQDFLRNLSEYGRTHPDFEGIVTKYHLNEVTSKPAAIPSKTAPAPAKAPSAPAKAPSVPAVPPAKK
jgi:hypothetical protein